MNLLFDEITTKQLINYILFWIKDISLEKLVLLVYLIDRERLNRIYSLLTNTNYYLENNRIKSDDIEKIFNILKKYDSTINTDHLSKNDIKITNKVIHTYKSEIQNDDYINWCIEHLKEFKDNLGFNKSLDIREIMINLGKTEEEISDAIEEILYFDWFKRELENYKE